MPQMPLSDFSRSHTEEGKGKESTADMSRQVEGGSEESLGMFCCRRGIMTLLLSSLIVSPNATFDNGLTLANERCSKGMMDIMWNNNLCTSTHCMLFSHNNNTWFPE